MDLQDFGRWFGPRRPTGVVATIKWLYEQYRRHVATAKRTLAINSNKNSGVKVGGYTYGLSKTVTLGVASTFSLSAQPDTIMRFQRVVSNAPCPGMFYITTLQGCHQGDKIDAFNLKDLPIDYPTLSPANRIFVAVEYTGRVPTSQRLDRAEAHMRLCAARAGFLQHTLVELTGAKSLRQVRKIIAAASTYSPMHVPPDPDMFTFSIAFVGPSGIV